MDEAQNHSLRNRILGELIAHLVIFGAALLFMHIVFFRDSVPKWFRMQMPFLLGVVALAVAYVMTAVDVRARSSVEVTSDPLLPARWLISRVGMVYGVLMLAAAFAGLFGDPPTRGWYFLVPIVIFGLSYYGLWSIRPSSGPKARDDSSELGL